MRILLAVDGSDASMAAVAATAALPKPLDTSIEVVSVVPFSFAPEGAPWPAVIRVDPPTDRERVRDDVRTRLEAIAAQLRVDDVNAEATVLEGRAASEIVIEANRFAADLIVIGARGLSVVRRLLVGSVSSEVVDHAPCPVLVARRGSVDRLLLATDGSPDAERAVDFVTHSGLFDATEIQVVSVVESNPALWTGLSPVDGMTSIEITADAMAAGERRTARALELASAQLQGRHVTTASTQPHGDVASTIVETADAWGADVVVLGARSLGAVHRWLIGSVSRAVLHHAPMSVLIVRPGAAVAKDREPEELLATPA